MFSFLRRQMGDFLAFGTSLLNLCRFLLFDNVEVVDDGLAEVLGGDIAKWLVILTGGNHRDDLVKLLGSLIERGKINDSENSRTVRLKREFRCHRIDEMLEGED